MSTLRLPLLTACATTLLLATAAHGATAQTEVLEEVVITAPYGWALPRDRVPARVQTVDAEEIAQRQVLDLADLLDRGFGSVHINHAQNNPLQPDLNFRGQTASPLLGLAQGLSVYANGVRLNETFGDTVNWDLLPLSALQGVQLIGGTQPVFGLNSLAGALSLRLKTGFDAEGGRAEALAGSFGRESAALQYGANNGRWGIYGTLDHFSENGWRDYSASHALRGFAALGYRNGEDRVDLSLVRADSHLRGNGPAPVELLAQDRSAVFTHPDITDNRMTLAIAEGATTLAPGLKLSGTLFHRQLQTRSFNGDGTVFEECDVDGAELLVEEDFTDLDGDDACTAGIDTDIELVRDARGMPLAAELDGAELDAVNNLGLRRQRSQGASAQLAHEAALGEGRKNHFTLGAAWIDGHAAFDAQVEVASLLADRSTSRSGLYADEFATAVDSDVRTWSLYAANTLDLTPRLSLELAGRYDQTLIVLQDRSGQSPELNGRHRFGRLNPALGLAWRSRRGWQAYASLAQASRTPTAVELACADEDAPCSLPNAFLADPPLDEVVARTLEAGLRGRSDTGLDWHVGLFRTVNRDDILFQTTGGPQGNVGFFDNVADTRRQGVEIELGQRLGVWSWQLDVSLLDAQFRDPFVVNSPNHPLFADGASAPAGAGRVVGDGKLQVGAGDQIPGIPRQQAKLQLDWRLSAAWQLGADLQYRSGVFLRGDEVNLLDRTRSYALVNLRAQVDAGAGLVLLARVENLLGRQYESFGLLGEPDEVLAGFADPRFLGAGPPRGAWLGARWQF